MIILSPQRHASEGQEAYTGMGGGEKVRKEKEANNTARREGRKNGKIYREMAITGKLFRPENMNVQFVTLLFERHTCLPGMVWFGNL